MGELRQNLVNVWHRVDDHNLSLVAAGVAFYVFLSIFPALASVISLYGLAFNPSRVDDHFTAMADFMPKEVLNIVRGRMKNLADAGGAPLSLGVILGLLVSLWSANKAMKALAKALNIAYDLKERRGFIKFNLITLGLTLLSTVAFIFAVTLVVAMPILVSVFLTSEAEWLARILTWALYLSLLIAMYLILYRVAPARPPRRWRQLIPGALVSAFLFVIASTGFSLYVTNFGEYDKQYGALGAVVVTMLWLLIGAFIFLIGAEFNAERFHDKPKKS